MLHGVSGISRFRPQLAYRRKPSWRGRLKPGCEGQWGLRDEQPIQRVYEGKPYSTPFCNAGALLMMANTEPSLLYQALTAADLTRNTEERL